MAVEEFTYLRGRTKRPVNVTLVSAQQAAGTARDVFNPMQAQIWLKLKF